MELQTFKYKTWADQRTLEAIDSIDRAHYSDAYDFALQQINHMVIVEELFTSRLCNKPAPHKNTNTDFVPALDELKKRLLASGVWYLDFISNCKDTSRDVSFVFADGQNGKMAIDEILFHIVNHGSYHRGNIARALDLAGVPHPIDGYAVYLHKIEPVRRQNCD